MNTACVVLFICIFHIENSYTSTFETHVKDNYQHIRNDCLAETGAPSELVDKINEGIFSEEQSVKCYMKCLVSSFGKFNEDGSINVDSLIKYIPDAHHDDYIALLRACENIVGTDLCDTAFKSNICYYKTNPNEKLHGAAHARCSRRD